MYSFKSKIGIIGINPFVSLPHKILTAVFKQAGKDKGYIPVGEINDIPYKQTLVRYRGEWRLYINTTMLKNSPKRIGEQIAITITFDPEDRSIALHPKLSKALNKNKTAKKIFNSLPASRQKEIIRYIAALKTEEARDKNIQRAIGFLSGKTNFIGREKP